MREHGSGMLAALMIAAGAWCAGGAMGETISVKDADLVPYVIAENGIAQSLTGRHGDPASGLKIAVNRKLGNCLGCHAMPVKDVQFPGNLGPDLAGVGTRLSEAELRLRLVDAKRVNPATSMPGFYKIDGLNGVDKKHLGKPMLSAEQIEDLVAYLASLKN